jgi:SpoVK/Ycf46/Vps4 family AAA+-type ATPase
MKAPNLFTGLRSLPRGILLFGPPGTGTTALFEILLNCFFNLMCCLIGKTLIGKAIAHQSGATFFSISASSLMSKWIGEGEKTVRTLFAVASYRQPSVVFIDEIDSLLCQRSSDENEATRRIKTEFMVQLDGAGTSADSRVVILGATNRPEELDEAVRRRFVKRLYIPLPDSISRKDLIHTLLKDEKHDLTPQDIDELVRKTEGFSGADLRAVCTEAAMGPLRELLKEKQGNISNVSKDELDHIQASHFNEAFSSVKPSVSSNDLQRYVDWNNAFGSYRLPVEEEI